MDREGWGGQEGSYGRGGALAVFEPRGGLGAAGVEDAHHRGGLLVLADKEDAQQARGGEVTRVGVAAKAPKLVVLELLGGVLEVVEEEGDEEGGMVYQMLPGVGKALREMRRDGSGIGGAKVAIMVPSPPPAWVEPALHAVQVSQGVSLFDFADMIAAAPALSPDTKVSGTLRSVLMQSAMNALQRASKVKFAGMLFFGAEARVCRDLEHLGVTAHRVPYGLDARAWQLGIARFSES
ncbi:hypothetical protein T484DRAFT_1935608 [Baffinella frigidus]|nr:hypothetical protein T484DRAFT_1935608 [Cryptophyta sp. CCMP2293]